MPKFVNIAPAPPRADTAPPASTTPVVPLLPLSIPRPSPPTLPTVPLPPAPRGVPARLPSPPRLPPPTLAPTLGAPPSDADMAGRLRHLIAETGKPLICPGVYDSLTARIAIEQGFKSLYITPTGTFASLLGRPDMGMTTLSEMVRNARIIAGIAHPTGVPVIASVDPSLGGCSVEQTTREYIRSGIAGIILSDIDPTGPLTTQQQGQTKVMSGRAFYSLIDRVKTERQIFGKDIVIIAQSVGRELRGYDRTARRLNTAIAHGADVVWLEGADPIEKPTFYELVKPTPVLHCVGPQDHTPRRPSLEAGVHSDHIILFPDVALGAVLHGVRRATKYLKRKGKNPTSAQYDPRDLERLLGQIEADGG